MWLLYAAGSAFFAGVTSILAKIGIRKTDSTVATALRTIVILFFSWGIVLLTDAQAGLSAIGGRTLLFLVMSGLATGASWLCYFRALQQGEASVVVPIDKMSIVVTILFAGIFLKERLSRRALIGLLLVVGGTLLLVV